MGPFDAWNAIPLLGQLQIIWTIAGLEHASECLDPAGHYTKGGTPGNLKFLKVRALSPDPHACEKVRAPMLVQRTGGSS